MKQIWYFIIGVGFMLNCECRPHFPNLREIRTRLLAYRRSVAAHTFDIDLEECEFVTHDVPEKFMTPDPPYPYWFQLVQRMCAPILFYYLAIETQTLLLVNRYISHHPTDSLEHHETSIES